MSLMGVDVGTTGVKAAVFGRNGEFASSAYLEYDLLFPFPGASELDSRRVLDAAYKVIAQAAGEVRDTDPVEAIGVASQGEAFTPVMSDGEMLANIMTSSDSRAQSLVEPWAAAFGKEKLYRITGHTAYPMYSLFKLLWTRQNRPDVWQRAWKFLFCQDLIAFGLTGETATDYTMAARSMLFDVGAKQWSREICTGIGLDTNRLPAAVPSGTVTGGVKTEIAESLGLGRGVKVILCGHDQPVGALGCGAATAGCSSYSIGTVECICPATDRFILSDKLMSANLATYPHVLPGLYTTVAFNVTGGSVLKWVRDNLATEEAEAARQSGEDPYARIIAAASDKPADLVLLPHFGPTGTPHFDAHGAGVLFGLSLSSTRAEVLRAVLEGITYEMKLNLSILADSGFALSEMRAVGGGARSDIWMQIKADILGIPLTTMQVSEATCMGAAMLAGQGLGALDPADAQSKWAAPIRTFDPRKQNAALYEDRFALYKELYDSLGQARKMLADLKGENYD
jgi:xylulokinase